MPAEAQSAVNGKRLSKMYGVKAHFVAASFF
jgi:hypothetical protein